MKVRRRHRGLILLLAVLMVLIMACSKDESAQAEDPTENATETPNEAEEPAPEIIIAYTTEEKDKIFPDMSDEDITQVIHIIQKELPENLEELTEKEFFANGLIDEARAKELGLEKVDLKKISVGLAKKKSE